MEPSSGISSRNRPRRLISGSLHTVDAVLAGYYEDEATSTIDSLLFGTYRRMASCTSSGSFVGPPSQQPGAVPELTTADMVGAEFGDEHRIEPDRSSASCRSSGSCRRASVR